jgi:death on curing protein
VSWQWLSKQAALVFHEETVTRHGGVHGVRDNGLLESALARPENLAAYGKPDAAAVAAAYAFGVAKNHPFADGNKRTATVLMETSLALNGFDLTASDDGLLTTIVALAASEMTEEQLADWLRGHLRPLS